MPLMTLERDSMLEAVRISITVTIVFQKLASPSLLVRYELLLCLRENPYKRHPGKNNNYFPSVYSFLRARYSNRDPQHRHSL